MKKLVFIFILILVVKFDSPLFAQNWRFGLQGGSVIANTHRIFEPDNETFPSSFDPIFGFNVNGYVQYNINKLMGLSIEPGYIQKGETQVYREDDPNDDVSIYMNYLQLPVLGHVHFAKYFFVSFGPEFAYLMKVMGKSSELEVDISKYYEKDFELSAIVSIGATIINHVDLEIRYNHGITNYRKLPITNLEGDVISEASEYNQYLQLILRFKL